MKLNEIMSAVAANDQQKKQNDKTENQLRLKKLNNLLQQLQVKLDNKETVIDTTAKIKELTKLKDEVVAHLKKIENDERSVAGMKTESVDKKSAQLKELIDQNKQPLINDAHGFRDGFAWGDLQEIGYAEEKRQKVARDLYNVWWVYTGPNPVRFIPFGHKNKTGEKQRIILLKTGDATEPVEVDYS